MGRSGLSSRKFHGRTLEVWGEKRGDRGRKLTWGALGPEQGGAVWGWG